MTDQTKLSEKVTTALLDRMYNYFVKITDWVMKGKESKYPMPKALAWLFDTTESNANEVVELKQLVTTLQQNLVQREQRISQLDTALQNVNAVLKQVVDLANAPQPTPATPAPVAPAPAPVEVTEELVDLDDVASTEPSSGGVSAVPSLTPSAPQPAVSPNEQAIQVSAEAVGAGNIDPASYAALDAVIGALLSK